MVSTNTPMARAFFDHYDQKRQKARRAGGATAPRPQPINTATFTSKVGNGATTTDNGTISIAYGTTTTGLRGSTAVVAGKRYRIYWTMTGSGGQAAFGTSLGGLQYRPFLAGVVGANLFEFTAQSGEVFISLQRTASGTSTFNLSIVEIAEVSWFDTDTISPATFSILTATVTVNSETGVITIPATGTQLNARGSFATEIGKLYRVRYVIAGNTAFLTLGITNGGSQLKTAFMSELGQRYWEFTATTTVTWINFHRVTNGTATVSDIELQAVAPETHFSDEFSQEFA